MDEIDLFSHVPQLSIAVLATPNPGQDFNVDEHYRLSIVDQKLVVIRGVSIVGQIDSPPPSIIDMMHSRCPSVLSRVVRVFTLTKKAELLLE